jgi:hypothetical protein
MATVTFIGEQTDFKPRSDLERSTQEAFLEAMGGLQLRGVEFSTRDLETIHGVIKGLVELDQPNIEDLHELAQAA